MSGSARVQASCELDEWRLDGSEEGSDADWLTDSGSGRDDESGSSEGEEEGEAEEEDEEPRSRAVPEAFVAATGVTGASYAARGAAAPLRGAPPDARRPAGETGGAAEWDILSFVSEPDTDDEEVAGGLGTAAESGGEGEGPSEAVAGPAERRVSVEGGVARRTRAHVSLQHYDIEQLEKFLTVRVARGAGCARRH